MPRYTTEYKLTVLDYAKQMGPIKAAKYYLLPPKTIERWNDLYHIYEKLEMRKFSDEQRIEILNYANEYGMTSASREYGIDAATLRSWNRKYNIYEKNGRHENATHVKKFTRATEKLKETVLAYNKKHGPSKTTRHFGVPMSTLQTWMRAQPTYTPRQKRVFSPEMRLEIIQFANETSLADAAKKYNLGSGHIKRWMIDAGVGIDSQR